MSSSEDLFYSAVSGKRPSGLSEARAFRLILLKRIRLRREGSLAAALTQSMALAVMGTAGAYPSWVLVQGAGEAGSKKGAEQVVLGAAWAITREDPAPGAPLLGPAGGPLMLGMAFCCLFSVLSGTLALTLDFLGRRRGRSLAPLAHGLTAVLIACAAALGSCLLALVRGRVYTEPELRPRRLRTSPGQSLFLAFLACALASTATGLSCSSPARVEPARSSWDFRARTRDLRPARFLRPRRRRPDDEEEGVSSSSSTSVAAATAAYLKSKYRAGVPSESRSGKVHWPDQGTLEYLPEERAFRRRPTLVSEAEEEEDEEDEEKEEDEEAAAQEPGEEEEREGEAPTPGLPPAASPSLQRYWAASWSILSRFGNLFERAPQREASAPPDRGEEEEEQGGDDEEEEDDDDEEEEEAEAGHGVPFPSKTERGSLDPV